MKKNNEKIMKYISAQMNETERSAFENELAESKQLQLELSEIKNRLTGLNVYNDLNVEETYFTNLLPRVHERLRKKKRFWKLESIYYLVPSTAAVVVLFFFIFNSKKGFETQYKDIANEIANNITDQEVSDKYLSEIETEPLVALVPQNNDELNLQIPSDLDAGAESFSALIDNPIADDFSTLRRLSNKDLEVINKNLNSLILR